MSLEKQFPRLRKIGSRGVPSVAKKKKSETAVDPRGRLAQHGKRSGDG